MTHVRLNVYRPGSFGPAVQQKIHHALRIEVSGINPEPARRQVIEALLDHPFELVNRLAVGCGLDTGGERRGFGVIAVAVAVRQVRGFFGQPVKPALP